MLKELFKVFFQDRLDRMTMAEIHLAVESEELTFKETRRVMQMQRDAIKLA